MIESENIQQFFILLCSGISIWAFAGIKYKRLGFIFGLISQPFWFWSSFQTQQWGIFIVSIWFTINHIRGLYNWRKL